MATIVLKANPALRISDRSVQVEVTRDAFPPRTVDVSNGSDALKAFQAYIREIKAAGVKASAFMLHKSGRRVPGFAAIEGKSIDVNL